MDRVFHGYWHSLGTAGLDNNSQTDPYAVTLTPGAPENLTADFGYYVDGAALGIRDSVLHKKEALSDEEWKTMRDHPAKSYKILSALEFLDEEMRIAFLHHERYDCRQYGTGLKGDEIPIEAAVLAVADTFDAMNSERPYRSTMPKDAIVAEFEKNKGKQHAAPLVDAFLGLLDRKPELWIRN